MDEEAKFIEELDRMFVDHLTRRDKASAAHVLVQQFEFLRSRSWSEACATAKKTVDLFGTSGDKLVMKAVEEAYGLLFQELPADDPGFIDVCRTYGHFLHRQGDAHSASTIIAEIDYALDGVDNSAAVALLEDFLKARLSQLSLEDEVMLRARLASNYLYICRFEDAVTTCTWLLLNTEDSNSWDYILWCGEAYMKLGRKNLAAMHFREVQRGLGEKLDDERVLQAKDFLDRMR